LDYRTRHGSQHVCKSDNTEKSKPCIDNFIAYKLNCSLPWTKTPGLKCSTKEKLDIFFDITLKLNSGELEEEIKEYGCGIQNCIKNTWQPQTALTTATSTDQEDFLPGDVDTYLLNFMRSYKVCLSSYVDILF
jgi:hypothetical protein